MINEADILSIIASSAALAISGMPFMGPVGASRVGCVDGKYVINKKGIRKFKIRSCCSRYKRCSFNSWIWNKWFNEEEMLNAVKFGHAILFNN